MFALKTFCKQLYGPYCVIMTDLKPLVSLFGEHKQNPNTALPRLAITLPGYEYKIHYNAGRGMAMRTVSVGRHVFSCVIEMQHVLLDDAVGAFSRCSCLSLQVRYMDFCIYIEEQTITRHTPRTARRQVA